MTEKEYMATITETLSTGEIDKIVSSEASNKLVALNAAGYYKAGSAWVDLSVEAEVDIWQGPPGKPRAYYVKAVRNVVRDQGAKGDRRLEIVPSGDDVVFAQEAIAGLEPDGDATLPEVRPMDWEGKPAPGKKTPEPSPGSSK